LTFEPNRCRELLAAALLHGYFAIWVPCCPESLEYLCYPPPCELPQRSRSTVSDPTLPTQIVTNQTPARPPETTHCLTYCHLLGCPASRAPRMARRPGRPPSPPEPARARPSPPEPARARPSPPEPAQPSWDFLRGRPPRWPARLRPRSDRRDGAGSAARQRERSARKRRRTKGLLPPAPVCTS